MQKIPKSFSEVKAIEYMRWVSSLEENPELNEAQQFMSLKDIDSVEYVTEYGGKVFPDYFKKVMGQAAQEFKKWKSVEIPLFNSTVVLTKEEDNLKLTFGAVAQIKDLHNSVIAKTTGNPIHKDMLDSLEGVEPADMTTEQEEFLNQLDRDVKKEYMSVIIDMLAWYCIGKAGVAVTEENQAIAKNIIENMSAAAIIPVTEFFFIMTGRRQAYMAAPRAFLLLEISRNL